LPLSGLVLLVGALDNTLWQHGANGARMTL
jgi:hypothetical protein